MMVGGAAGMMLLGAFFADPDRESENLGREPKWKS